MIDVINKRCDYPDGCMTRPTFGHDQGKASRCGTHRVAGMRDVKNKRCQHSGCNTQPNYGFVGGKALFCRTHMADDMWDVISTTCEHPGCTSQPNQGYEKGKALTCAIHKRQGMRNVKTKRCEHDGCDTIPGFGFASGPALRCAEHKSPGMTISSGKCATSWCTTSAANPAYRGHCLRCFAFKFPDEPASRNYKVKENSVREHIEPWLKETFPDLEFTFDRRLQGGCSGRRPDIFIDALTHVVLGEIDEDQHENTPCENRRTMEIFQDAGNRPLVIVRLNPDAYMDAEGKRHKSPFALSRWGKLFVKDKKEWAQRLEAFRAQLERNITTIPEREVQVDFLYYNGHDDATNATAK